MIDYYWLKSFTEILQLFLSIFFIIYLRIKYERLSTPLMWLSTFFYIKLLTDLYGILNYTSWISEILSRPVLRVYRVGMGAFEVGMIISFILFVYSAYTREIKFREGSFYFIIALLFMPLNWILWVYFQSQLLGVFDFIKLLWIGTMAFLIFRYIEEKHLQLFAFLILLWNSIWLAEVVLHQQLLLISEPASWLLFVMAELILTIGIAGYLIQLIAHPKIVKFERLSTVLPKSIQNIIKKGLDKVLKEEKAYLDSELSATKLADKIGVAPIDLTLYLNRLLNKNFNQFVNDFRIAESKRLLSSPQNKKMTIEQVMYESGFNSKSVFNTAFKANTGLTPSAFRKSRTHSSQ